MLVDPFEDVGGVDLALGQRQAEPGEVVVGHVEGHAVEIEQDQHDKDADAFVPIDEWMVVDRRGAAGFGGGTGASLGEFFEGWAVLDDEFVAGAEHVGI